MSSLIQKQLNNLKTMKYTTDNRCFPNDLSKPYTEILFNKKSQQTELENKVKVVFEDYIIRPFEGFDFHDKWNNGNSPKSKTMYGKIEKETKGMYFFNLHSESMEYKWSGWCPKKSCKVITI